MRKTLLFLTLLVIATPAAALRCGNDLVGEGDDTLTLLARCGQPALREQFTEDRVVQRDNGTAGTVQEIERIPYEVWTYNFGPQRFLVRVEIRGGRISAIINSGYGF